jgi:hypothetical protein
VCRLAVVTSTVRLLLQQLWLLAVDVCGNDLCLLASSGRAAVILCEERALRQQARSAAAAVLMTVGRVREHCRTTYGCSVWLRSGLLTVACLQLCMLEAVLWHAWVSGLREC